jgi:phenylacetate-CoA ligase
MSSTLEMFYPVVPVWAQNLGVSLYGLAWRRERLGERFDQYVREFRERDAWPAERLNQYLEAELRRVLTRAFAEVPYYARRWRAAGIGAGDLVRFSLSDLRRLPTTPKQDLRENPEGFVSGVVRGSARLHRYHSSGTTGTPITAICTTDGHRRFIAAREARSFGWAGTSIRRPRSMIGGRMVVPKGVNKPPFHRYNWAEKQVYSSAYHISPANVPHYVAALNRYQPRVFTGYAYSHYLLARMMLAQGSRLDYEPEALVLSSEKLTAEMKSVICQAFGARAYEEYGCVENCALATECEQGQLHVSPDFGIVEIVDGQGCPAPPGLEGRMLCTSLLNEAQPLIRYEIGDLGAWSEEPCPCGRNHLPVLKEVVGRLEDVVAGPDGRQMVRFHGIFIGLPNVIEGQVIQESLDRFTVKLATLDGFGEREEQVIRNRFEERLGKVRVQVLKVPDIPRTDRGKFRAVISNLKASSEPR